jgi:putative peptidase family protein
MSHQIVLIEGHIPTPKQMDGTITIRYMRNQCPVTSWPVSDSRFKALVYLNSGPNGFTLEFSPAGSRSKYSSSHMLVHHPMISCPAIKLVIVHAKDSKYAKMSLRTSETTDLSIAKAKFRMAAYLWQIFCAEQMGSRENPRRTFQLENEWRESTLFSEDIHTEEMRNEAPIHVVSLEETLDEVTNMSETKFVSSVETALAKRFGISARQATHYCCLFMDSEWNHNKQGLKRGFAYGGPGVINGKNIKLAIYGDHLLPYYPSSIDRVTATFSDESATPVAPESVKWKCASAGIGTHLQQVLHMLGLPKQSSGVMSDESVNFASMFSLYASHSMPQPRLHDLDAIRLRHHSTMRTPFAPIERIRPHTAPTFWGVNESTIFIASRAGLSAIEIYNPGEKVCKHWINLLDKRGCPRFTYQLSMTEIIKQCLSGRSVGRLSFRPGPYALMILTADGNSTPVEDLERFARSLIVSQPGNKGQLFRSKTVGSSVPQSSKSSILFPQSTRMLGLTVFHTPGSCITGIEFAFEGDIKKLIGNQSGDSSKEWRLRAIDGELLLGMELCVQESLEGLRLFTSAGRLSPWFGNASPGTE